MHGIRTCIHENALRAQTHICNTIHDLPAHQHNHERTNNNNFVVALGKKPVQELHVCLLCIIVSVCAFECACVLACSVYACVRTGGKVCCACFSCAWISGACACVYELCKCVQYELCAPPSKAQCPFRALYWRIILFFGTFLTRKNVQLEMRHALPARAFKGKDKQN